jgi:16S rRNA (adenine1518-N6/adenine1519-N6)-dimethyltransferase
MLKANKNLGQHFLVDEKVIEAITTDFQDECDVIFEVGPGPAVLTKHLAKKEKPFYVFELDKRMEEYLCPIVDEDKINFTDALHFDWHEFIEKNNLKDKKIWMVSNLPYQVSSGLFIAFLQVPQIQFFTLMFQKEVAEKILPPQGQKNSMSSLNFLGENYFEISKLKKVLPGAFNPPPKVDSLVISGVRKDNPTIEIDKFKSLETFLRLVFSQKRKQLSGLLKKTYPNIQQILQELEIDPKVRAEALDHSQILRLFEALEN